MAGEKRNDEMAAYVFAEVEVTNPEGYKEYTTLVPPTIAHFGGRFLARGGEAHALEGDWPKVRRVLIEFPSMDAAKKWFASPEYAKALALRRANSKGRLILLDGVSP